MAVALDGFAAGSATSASSITSSGLTTTSNSDVIVAYIFSTTAPGSAPTVLSMSGAGVAWNGLPRVSANFGTSGIHLTLWYGLAVSPLISVPITANLSGTATDNTIVVFGVSGTALAVDSNASLPALNHGTNTTPMVPSVSTTTRNCFVFGVTANGVSQGAGTGFTFITEVGPIGPVVSAAQYGIVTGTLTGVSVAFSAASTGSNWQMVVDALVEGGLPASVVLSGAGSLAVSPQTKWQGALVLGGTGSLSAFGAMGLLGVAALGGTGQLSSGSLVAELVSSVFSGTGRMSISATVASKLFFNGAGSLSVIARSELGIFAKFGGSGHMCIQAIHRIGRKGATTNVAEAGPGTTTNTIVPGGLS